MPKSVWCWLVLLVGTVSGCAPARFEPAEAHFANQHRVTDASVRRVASNWDLRFNQLLLSDLSEAIESEVIETKRSLAKSVIENASQLGCESAANEIRRLPQISLSELAKRGDCQPKAEELITLFQESAKSKLQQRGEWIEAASLKQLDRYLKHIAWNVELKPDEKFRFWRVALLHWGTVPALVGIEATEKQLQKELPVRLNQIFQQATISCRSTGNGDEPVYLHSPIIVQQWPTNPTYNVDFNRFGAVQLLGTPQDLQVRINTAQPTVYCYTGKAKINGQVHDQLVYVWWYPRRPAMAANDAIVGDIDGATFRITLDSHNRPAIFEVVQACGCGHLVFVSENVEKAAQAQFKTLEAGKTLFVERAVASKRDLFVAGTVKTDPAITSPTLFVEAGYHSIIRIALIGESVPPGRYEATEPYQLARYEELDRLPLGAGVASMFGADGLVHNAGRKEGYLLAPTGMLSAGQPRKRGTQKIRWDQYDFDDPHLLERTLRLPDDF